MNIRRPFLIAAAAVVVIAIAAFVLRSGATSSFPALYGSMSRTVAPGTGGVTTITNGVRTETYGTFARAPVDPKYLADRIARVHNLMLRAPSFNQIDLGPKVRMVRYRPAWIPDDFMITNSGQIWVTYWPFSEASHPPEELGILSRGVLQRVHLPAEPYYSLSFDYWDGPIPFVSGTPLTREGTAHLAIFPNGQIVKSDSLPAYLRGHGFGFNLCQQGTPASGVALYAVGPHGERQPILTYAVWQAATLGLWHGEPLGCAGRFAGEYFTGFGFSGVGAIYRISQGRAMLVGMARPGAISDHVMVLMAPHGEEIIEAYWP